MEFYVPGSTCRQECERYKVKKLFATILPPSDESVMTYFTRTTQDYDLPKGAGILNSFISYFVDSEIRKCNSV